jgi:hypothetical protein
MIKTQHPWQAGPTELIEFALERMHKGEDFDRRIAFLILDVGVETLFKTYLTLPDSVTQFQIKRADRREAVDNGNFHDLLRAVQNANPKKAATINFAYIEHYHNLRNTLYHQGNQVAAVPMNQLDGYAKLAVNLLREYLDVNLSSKLKRPPSAGSVGTNTQGGHEAEGRKRWTYAMFFADAEKKLKKDEIKVVNQLYEFTKQNAAEVRMGSGADSGSFTFILIRNNTTGSVFSVYSNGDFSVNLGYMAKIFTRDEIDNFRNRIATIPSLAGIKTTDKYYFTLKCGTAFLRPDFLEQFKKEVLDLKSTL